MSGLTTKSKTSVIAFVVILTGLMLGFHYDNAVQGLFPDSKIEAFDNNKQCRPAGIKN